jgi:hypothetical protein
MILVTILAIAQVTNILLDNYHAGFEEIRILTERFSQALLPFNYTLNVLVPKIGSVLLLFGTYLVVNLVLIPLVRKIKFGDLEKIASVNIAKVMVLIIALGFLLALGANILSYYGRPDFFNYADYGILAKFGYNDQPLNDIFFGLERAIAIISGILLLTGIRELAIFLIERPGPRKAFRINISNNVTLVIFIYVIVLLLLNPMHNEFLQFLFVGGVLLAYYVYTTFWLFPVKGDRSFFKKSVLLPLLAAAYLCAMPVSIFFQDAWLPSLLLIWAIMLIIVTPVFWLLFQWRKDNIMALRGVSAELANSTADLQFLRAQINPHFLFNALNTLYGTALMEKADLTATGIQKLGDMMRFVLHENNKDFISMEKETEYLSNFIGLQKLRLQTSPDILIEDNIDEARCTQMIAPMLLVPLVENAFKHGISQQEKSWIQVKLECGTGTIYFEVKNSIHKNMEGDTEKDASGIGLANVKERLNLIYPNRHELYIHQTATEFIARLLIKETPSTN